MRGNRPANHLAKVGSTKTVNRAILLICSMHSHARQTKFQYYADRLAQMVDAEVYICDFDDISVDLAPNRFEVFDHRNNRSLASYDHVMFRGTIPKMHLAATVSHFLAEHSTLAFNDYRAYRSPNKLLQAVEFYQLQLPFPRTIYSSSRQRLRTLIEEQLAYPVIVKAVKSSKGRNNYLVKSAAEVEKFTKRPSDIDFLAQAYIEADCDYRLLVFGQDIVAHQRQAVSNSHLHNYSQGATIRSVAVGSLPKRAIAGARKLASTNGLTIAGIDVLIDATSGKHYFLEINSQPGWGKLEDDLRASLQKLFG